MEVLLALEIGFEWQEEWKKGLFTTSFTVTVAYSSLSGGSLWQSPGKYWGHSHFRDALWELRGPWKHASASQNHDIEEQSKRYGQIQGELLAHKWLIVQCTILVFSGHSRGLHMRRKRCFARPKHGIPFVLPRKVLLSHWDEEKKGSSIPRLEV